MKFSKFWIKHRETIAIGGENKQITVYGASDVSIDDAKNQALAKAKAVQDRIFGRSTKRISYEATIREEIVDKLDPTNVITRNNAGCLVLNSEKLMFIDIDKPPF